MTRAYFLLKIWDNAVKPLLLLLIVLTLSPALGNNTIGTGIASIFHLILLSIGAIILVKRMSAYLIKRFKWSQHFKFTFWKRFVDVVDNTNLHNILNILKTSPQPSPKERELTTSNNLTDKMHKIMDYKLCKIFTLFHPILYAGFIAYSIWKEEYVILVVLVVFLIERILGKRENLTTQ